MGERNLVKVIAFKIFRKVYKLNTGLFSGFEKYLENIPLFI